MRKCLKDLCTWLSVFLVIGSLGMALGVGFSLGVRGKIVVAYIPADEVSQ